MEVKARKLDELIKDRTYGVDDTRALRFQEDADQPHHCEAMLLGYRATSALIDECNSAPSWTAGAIASASPVSPCLARMAAAESSPPPDQTARPPPRVRDVDYSAFSRSAPSSRDWRCSKVNVIAPCARCRAWMS